MRWTCSTCDGDYNPACKICEAKDATLNNKAWTWYDNEEPMESFLDFTLTSFNADFDTYLYAHNGGRFDSHFVFNTLYNRKLSPTMTMTGLKIFDITVNKNKSAFHFRDSYLITQTALAGLPKAFALDVNDKVFID